MTERNLLVYIHDLDILERNIRLIKKKFNIRVCYNSKKQKERDRTSILS